MKKYAIVENQKVVNTINLETENVSNYLETLSDNLIAIPIEENIEYKYYSTSSEELLNPLKLNLQNDDELYENIEVNGIKTIQISSNLDITSFGSILVNTTGECTASITSISSGSNSLTVSVDLSNYTLVDPENKCTLEFDSIIDSLGFTHRDFYKI